MHVHDDYRMAKTYTSPKGSEFVIRKEGPLYYIHMKNGGVRPEFVDQRFTSFKMAERALDTYFAHNPKPVAREKTDK